MTCPPCSYSMDDGMPNSIMLYRTVLFGDCDPEGIVYTPRFSSFALEATHEAMAIWLGAPAIRALKELGVLTPVRAFNLEFLAPVRWDDTLAMNVLVTDVGKHSFSFAVRGYLSQQCLAFSASITYVTVSSASRIKTRVPPQLRAVLVSGEQTR